MLALSDTQIFFLGLLGTFIANTPALVIVILTYLKTSSTHDAVNGVLAAKEAAERAASDVRESAAGIAGQLQGRKEANENNAAIREADAAGDAAK